MLNLTAVSCRNAIVRMGNVSWYNLKVLWLSELKASKCFFFNHTDVVCGWIKWVVGF